MQAFIKIYYGNTQLKDASYTRIKEKRLSLHQLDSEDARFLDLWDHYWFSCQ